LGKFWSFECLAMKDVDKFYGHLVYSTSISHILWQFGIFCGHFWHIFYCFGMLVPGKIWQPFFLPSSVFTA
jgi:hypothetical protein